MVEVSGVAPLSISETTPASPSAAAVLPFTVRPSPQPDGRAANPVNLPEQLRVLLFRQPARMTPALLSQAKGSEALADY